MDNLTGLIEELGQLPWQGDPEAVHQQAEQLFADHWRRKDTLLRRLATHLEEMRLPVVTRTAELHSWLLYSGDGFDLKLNQFKPSSNTGKASENVHDHTRALTSLTIQGGYTQDYYHPDLLAYPVGSRFGEISHEPGEETHSGHVYTINSKLFHALNGFADGTMTLVVYGKITKNKITVFNTVSGFVEERTTGTFAKTQMIEQLRLMGRIAVLGSYSQRNYTTVSI